MNKIVLFLCLASYGLLYAAATESDDSCAMSGSGSEALDKDIHRAVIDRPNEHCADYLAAEARALPGSRFNTQCVSSIHIGHEQCSMLAIADDSIGHLDELMRRKLQNTSGASIWSDMRKTLTDIAAPTTHAAILLVCKNSLSMYVKGAASKILIVWPDSIMELVAPPGKSTDDGLTIPLDAGLKGVLLLRNVAHTKETTNDLFNNPLLQDKLATDVVSAFMEPNVSEDKAVGYFDCQQWATFLKAQRTRAKTSEGKKSKRALLRRIFSRKKIIV